MKIVFLDVKTIGEDIDLSKFDLLGDVVKYDFTKPDQVSERVEEADVIILNKVQINESTIRDAKQLKLVCVTATGTDNLDKEYLNQRGIAWRNVSGYSTESVAQHTFAILFYLFEKMRYYDDYVKNEHYLNDQSFTHFENVFHDLSGKTWGIIGMGNIGKRVAQIAECFGCQVIYYSTSGKNNVDRFKRVEWDELLAKSDIISVHAPLNEQTQDLMNLEAFQKMKRDAFFLNLGRGAIVVEEDLLYALEHDLIKAAGVDVLRQEPMSENNPLRKMKDSNKLLITPHIAWASLESRTRLMDIIADQIKQFTEEN